MPQLVPFYFVNQVTFGFILIVILVYLFSKYILPIFVKSYTSRQSINSI